MQDNKNTVVFKVLSISSKYVLPGGKKKKSELRSVAEFRNQKTDFTYL